MNKVINVEMFVEVLKKKIKSLEEQLQQLKKEEEAQVKEFLTCKPGSKEAIIGSSKTIDSLRNSAFVLGKKEALMEMKQMFDNFI